MATETHTQGDTQPLMLVLPADDAVAVSLQVHTVSGCIEIGGSIAGGTASFDPRALDDLAPGRAYRTTARITRTGGAVRTIDSFVVRIEAGCGAPPVPPVRTIAADTLITSSTIIQEAA